MNPDKRLRKTGEPVIVCVCGMAGSGKSVLAKRLAQKYGLRYYSGGDVLRALAISEGYKNLESGWWESKEGMRFLERRGETLEFDRAIDEKLVEFAKEGNVIMDSWTMPWLLDKGFKIWLEASVETRAERVARRDHISVAEALKALRKKEDQTRSIYKKLYGFNLGEDYTPFHLILDTDNLKAEEVFNVLCTVMDNYLLRE